MIIPKNSPNLIQIILNGFNNMGLTKAIAKKNEETISPHNRMSFDERSGQNEINKKIIPNSIPKLFSDDFLLVMSIYNFSLI